MSTPFNNYVSEISFVNILYINVKLINKLKLKLDKWLYYVSGDSWGLTYYKLISILFLNKINKKPPTQSNVERGKNRGFTMKKGT